MIAVVLPRTAINHPTEVKVNFIDILEPLGYLCGIATLLILLGTTTMPSINDFEWRAGEDIYRQPCAILSFTYDSSFPRVKLVSVSLPGYELRPRESKFASRTSDPSVVRIKLPSGLHGYSQSFKIDCFPLKGQPQPPQSSQLSFRMRWHKISWCRKRLVRRPNQID